jgi:hypothetical protein
MKNKTVFRGFLGAFDCCWMLRQWAAGDLSPRSCPARRRYRGLVTRDEEKWFRDKCLGTEAEE